ncbi:hypothetical protein EDB86DRAFT_2885108 [Lactarius hatsudake]|nr:hypothetical protein EDB86DRAFT_2885108 [Lactarius hatsudake]
MERPVTSKSRGICRYYNTQRGCFAGNKCKFQHGEHESITPFDKNKTCRYFAAGYCKRGEKCWFRHVLPADLTTAPDDSLICAICMEEPVTFGLLADCSHVFCIDCIRNWRGQESSSEDVTFSRLHKKCPYCRTLSKFVIPSSHFYPSGHPGKTAALERYKASLQRIPCRYFTASKPDSRYCPFGRDCMYQHQNEDGTPYIFNKGVDFHMPQQRVRMRGIFNSAAVNRSLYEYIRNIRAIFASREPSEVGLPDDPAFDEDAELEHRDSDSESDVTMFFTVPSMISAPELNPDAPTPEPVPTVFSSPSTTSLSTPLHDPPLVPEPSHIPTLHDTQSHDDPILRSIPSSPLTVGFLPSLTADSDTEPDVPGPVSTCSLPDSYQDSRLPQPPDESAAISDTAPPPRSSSPFPLPLFDACGPPGTARPYDDSPLPTLPDSSLRDIGESESVQSSLSEAPPLAEVGATASVPSSARELPGGATETRHQEPPFMTDGRGRVVWSCSAAKRGSSPLAIRSLT